MESIEAFLAATPEDKADAALALVSVLVGKLVQLEVIKPEEAHFLAAAAAEGCRASGNQRAANLIYHVFPESAAIDVEEEAGRHNVNIERITRQ